MPGSADIRLSVLVCSHNPKAAYLRRALEALRAQTLPPEHWELLVIDSASDETLAERFTLVWHPQAKHLREEEPGKARAFLRGLAASAAPLLVIVDDDNVLASDYLEQAIAIGRANPTLGAWGGNVTLQFEEPPPEWTRHYWPFLAQQSVAADAMVCNRELSQPLPVGAGCCVRKEVAQHYAAQLAGSPRQQALGPKGKALMRGEDADLVLTACDMGLARGLFKSLHLTHLIPPERLREEYLTRLVEGIQFSSYILEMCRDVHKAPPPLSWWWHVKFYCDCATKFGRKRRFYLANKRAQRAAREIYDLSRAEA